MPVYQLTDTTVMFSIDLWFRNIYEKSTGPWDFSEEKIKIFPLVLFPISKIRDDIKSVRTTPGDIKKRVSITLSGSLFCQLEAGSHQFEQGGHLCTLCGYDSRPKPPTRRPYRRPGRWERER